jgi:amino acid adenylation domain-containing protein
MEQAPVTRPSGWTPTAAKQKLRQSAWNGSGPREPGDLCLHDLFEVQAERTPDAVAVVFQDQHLTYCELNRQANRLAHHLQSLGVGPEVRVGVFVQRSMEMIVGLLAVLKAGGAYVPLDPDYPSDRVAFMLFDSAASVVLTQQNLLCRLPEQGAQILCLDTDWDAIAPKQEECPVSTVLPANLAYVIYTSGSTGEPKGVLVPHRSVVNYCIVVTRQYDLGPDDRVLQFASLSFDVALEELFPTWLSGATVVLRRDEALALGDFLQFVTNEGLAILNLPATFWHELVSHLARTEVELPPLLRSMIVGSEKVSAEHLAVWQELVGERIRWWNAYGPTEAPIGATLYEFEAGHEPRESRSVPIGRPLAHVQVYVLDEHIQPVPVGEPGELYIGGDYLTRGYLGRPGLTAERFLPNPFSQEVADSARPGARLYRTGDLARYLPDGNLEFLGRTDHQVKIRGFRIELGEIEATLAQHPHVRETIVVARDSDLQPGTQRLVAYLVADDGQAPASSELRRFLRQKLPEYMLPAAFVPLDALPLTPNGKVDRRALPAPDWSRSEREGAFVAPRTPVEEVLAGIWAQVLGIEHVGIHDNFFELGGHSLLATQVIARLVQAFSVRVSLTAFFEGPTIAALAREIAASEGPEPQALPLEPVTRDGPLPLSFAQQRLWFMDQLVPDSPLYNIPSVLHIEGCLDIAVLQRCLDEIVRRHEALRTTFTTVEGQPRQVIGPPRPVELAVVDFRSLPPVERLAQARRLMDEQGRRPFDLGQGPLLRATLVQLEDRVYHLLLTIHHIASDGWSSGVILDELGTLYEAFAAGQPSPLPELAIQYADVACWQRQTLQGEVLEKLLAYWRAQFRGNLPVLALPTDRPRPAAQAYRGAKLAHALPAILVEALERLGRRENASLFMVLLAAFQTLLYRYSGQTDIVVGTPIANRTRPKVEGLVGFFVNTLPLRLDLAGNPTFREFVGRVRQVALGAYVHQDLPFERLVKALDLDRNLSHNPLFQVAFALQNMPTHVVQLPGLCIRFADELNTGTAKFDLTLFVETLDQGPAVMAEYNTDLFEMATVERLVGHFCRLLESVVADPEQRILDLPLLTEAEQAQFSSWSGSGTGYPRDRCIHELFEAQAERTPDAMALVFASTESGGSETEHLTYRQLNSRANQLAHHLQARGVGPGEVVGLCIERSPSMIVGILGILKAGGAYVPLDPAYPRERLAFLLDDTRPSVVLTQRHLAERLPLDEPRLVCLDAEWAAIAQADVENPASDVTPEALAYVIYTSGSTGKPKGVMISHANLCPLLHWGYEHLGFTSADRVVQYLSYCFDWSVWEIFLTLTQGASLFVVCDYTVLDPQAAVDFVHEQGITALHATPTQFQVLMALDRKLETLKYACIGAEKLTFELVARCHDLLDAKCRIFNMYGPTEAAIITTVLEIDRSNLARYRDLSSVPIGPPVANARCYIVDPYDNLQPIGAPGELLIAGDGLSVGYWNRPALTAEKFAPQPFIPGKRVYRTGDLATWLADGTIEFLGRIDHQVKIRGFRIELGEIEATLNQHPAVGETVVLARETDQEPDRRRLVAYVLPREEAALAAGELRDFLREKLPAYMVPTAFVVLDAFPLMLNGKVDRHALPDPEWGQADREKGAVAPRTPVEEIVAGIWTQVLGIGRVGIHQNFFEMGGHSLLAAQITARLQQHFGVGLGVRALFESPTVAALAERVETSRQAEPRPQPPPIGRVSREEPLPLSFAQQQLWLIDQLQPGNAAYNSPLYLRLTGALDVAALRESLNKVIRRHESLRTTFPVVGHQPLQVIVPSLRLPLPVVDLCPLPKAERWPAARRLAREHSRQAFDLAQGPLLQAILLQLEDREHLLLLNAHHIVVDGWSMGVLLDELAALYRAFVAGQPCPLPDLPIQYADVACWQRDWLQGDELRRQLAFWEQQLSQAPAVLPLPTDRPRPLVQTYRGAQYRAELSKSLVEAAKALSQRQGCTLYMTLLAAFKALLYHYSGISDVVVGSPVANRHRPEIEGLVGYFVNTLVLRTHLAGDLFVRELLARVRETALAAYAHQELPFVKLVDALNPKPDRRYNPLFQVMFTFQGAATALPQLPGLDMALLAMDIGVAQFDLELEISETEQGAQLCFEYNTDLFNEATIIQMMNHYQMLVQGIVANPNQSLLMLLSAIQLEPRHPDPAVVQLQPDAAPLSDTKDKVAQRRARLLERQARLSAETRDLIQDRLRGE